ncbi:MAG TPA: ammonia channel protein, partial [Leptospiraceae bacterium]|nr:ammonia channel protein [Leptospiraceae bacterium]
MLTRKNIFRTAAILGFFLPMIIFGQAATTPTPAPATPPAPVLDKADTVWMIVSSALVFFMIPGLA